MTLVGYPKVIPYTNFEHFGIIRFGVMDRTVVWKMHLFTLWSCPLTFEPQNSNTSRVSQGHSLYKLSLNTGIVHFWLMQRDKQTDTQTDKQSDSKISPIPKYIVGVGKYNITADDPWSISQIYETNLSYDHGHVYQIQHHRQGYCKTQFFCALNI